MRSELIHINYFKHPRIIKFYMLLVRPNAELTIQSDGITAAQTYLAPIVPGVQNVGNPDQARCGTEGTMIQHGSRMQFERSARRSQSYMCRLCCHDHGRYCWPEQAITPGGIRQAEQKVDMVEADGLKWQCQKLQILLQSRCLRLEA